jgi:hypothetical protein
MRFGLLWFGPGAQKTFSRQVFSLGGSTNAITQKPNAFRVNERKGDAQEGKIPQHSCCGSTKILQRSVKPHHTSNRYGSPAKQGNQCLWCLVGD